MDRHLFALKYIAERANFPLSPSVQLAHCKPLNHTILSRLQIAETKLYVFLDSAQWWRTVLSVALHYQRLVHPLFYFEQTPTNTALCIYARKRTCGNDFTSQTAIIGPHTRNSNRPKKSIPHHMISYNLYMAKINHSCPPQSPVGGQQQQSRILLLFQLCGC